jgi:hypothetical protein
MINFIFQLAADVFIIKLLLRGYKMTKQGQDPLYETKTDHEMRVLTGWGIVALCVVAIICNHLFSGNLKLENLLGHSSSE